MSDRVTLFFLVFMVYLALHCSLMHAQPQPVKKRNQRISNTPQSETQFVADFEKKGYEILSRVTGKLDLDSIPDAILVLKKTGEEQSADSGKPLKRLFVLLTGKPGGKTTIRLQNENLVYYYNYDLNFKESLVDIEIKDAGFTINHYGGFATRWGRSTTFRYNNTIKDWLFEKDENVTFSSTDPENTTKEKTITAKQKGIILCRHFNMYKTW